jgi:hypothetical protein
MGEGVSRVDRITHFLNRHMETAQADADVHAESPYGPDAAGEAARPAILILILFLFNCLVLLNFYGLIK